jgi:hypothetical protein
MDGISNGFMLVIVAVMGLIFLTVLLGTIFIVCVGCSVIYEKAFPKSKPERKYKSPAEFEEDMDRLNRELEDMASKWERDSAKLSSAMNNSAKAIRKSNQDVCNLLDNL